MVSAKAKNCSTLDLITQLKLSSQTRLLQKSENISHQPLNADDKTFQFMNRKGLENYRYLSRPTSVPINSEEEERKRISRELHDGLGQLLTSINLHVQGCLNRCDQEDLFADPAGRQQRNSLESISEMVKQAITEVRSICRAIRPAILDDLGVVAAIAWQCRQISSGCDALEVVTDFDINEDVITEEYKTVIYRIVQESLNNALKYAQAKNISVSLLQSHDAIHLVITDDGVGFDPSQIQGKRGLGLVGMRERAESVRGRLRIDTGLNQGVQIRATFPLLISELNG
jgi:two-component system, NarL family, sensor kinase